MALKAGWRNGLETTGDQDRQNEQMGGNNQRMQKRRREYQRKTNKKQRMTYFVKSESGEIFVDE